MPILKRCVCAVSPIPDRTYKQMEPINSGQQAGMSVQEAIAATCDQQAPLLPVTTRINVRYCGAKGDGLTDDTAALQAAIDAAAEQGGGVWFPPGDYATSTLRMRSHVGLFADPTWSYHSSGGTRLKLVDPEVRSLLDLSGTYGVRLVGLGLEGGQLGDGVHGVYLDGTGHQQEDTVFIEYCRIAHFTGDGICLDKIWGFTVRNNMVIFNGGDGLGFSQWDGWIYENIFNNNGGYGIHGRAINSAISIVSNRIEWNHAGGICSERGSHYHINDNYIDRSGGPGIHLTGEAENLSHTFAITGNIIYRSGACAEAQSDRSSHLWFENVAGMVCSGNAMHVGVDDTGGGSHSPHYGIIIRSLSDSIIRDNTLHHGAVGQLLLDYEGHNDQTIIRDNVGSLVPAVENSKAAQIENAVGTTGKTIQYHSGSKGPRDACSQTRERHLNP